MLFWILLFLLILIISFILALRSMEDYRDIPQPGQYSLYLVRQEVNLDLEIMKRLYEICQSQNSIISLERLFKGKKSALVIYSSVSITKSVGQRLDLLELEDYSYKINTGRTINPTMVKFVAWEAAVTNPKTIFIPSLGENDQMWFQQVLVPVGDGLLEKALNFFLGSGWRAPNKSKSNEQLFYTTLRVVILADDSKRVEELQNDLILSGNEMGLIKIPQPYTSSQIAQFYQQRAVQPHYNKANKQYLKLHFKLKEVLALTKLRTRDT